MRLVEVSSVASVLAAELIIRRIIVFILICALLLPPLNPYLGVLGRGQALDVGGLKMLHDMAVAKPSLPTQIGIGGPSNGSLLIIATQVRRRAHVMRSH
ncbi:hypothetical protein V8C86DRAFT_2734785, partial [Haematococcus lacustris]